MKKILVSLALGFAAMSFPMTALVLAHEGPSYDVTEEAGSNWQ